VPHSRFKVRLSSHQESETSQNNTTSFRVWPNRDVRLCRPVGGMNCLWRQAMTIRVAYGLNSSTITSTTCSFAPDEAVLGTSRRFGHTFKSLSTTRTSRLHEGALISSSASQTCSIRCLSPQQLPVAFAVLRQSLLESIASVFLTLDTSSWLSCAVPHQHLPLRLPTQCPHLLHLLLLR